MGQTPHGKLTCPGKICSDHQQQMCDIKEIVSNKKIETMAIHFTSKADT